MVFCKTKLATLNKDNEHSEAGASHLTPGPASEASLRALTAATTPASLAEVATNQREVVRKEWPRLQPRSAWRTRLSLHFSVAKSGC